MTIRNAELNKEKLKQVLAIKLEKIRRIDNSILKWEDKTLNFEGKK